MSRWLLGLICISAVALAAEVGVLAESEHWKISSTGPGTVLVSGPVQIGSGGPVLSQEITLINPRFTRWDVDNKPWRAVDATISKSENSAFLRWKSSTPIRSSTEIVHISLQDFRLQNLPYSDLANSGVMPIWSPDESYAAASGGHTVRLWKLNPEVSVLLLPAPKVGKLQINYAENVRFGKDGRTQLTDYQLILPDNHADSKRKLLTTYSVPGGKILSTKVVNTP